MGKIWYMIAVDIPIKNLGIGRLCGMAWYVAGITFGSSSNFFTFSIRAFP